MSPIILFYRGTHPDDRGRMLADILRQDDAWLEKTHDYIQWVFPNCERSRITPGSPVIDDEVMQEFNQDEFLRNQLQTSFDRILAFYGLQVTESVFGKSRTWNERNSNWFIHDTHNNLRITRILKCLKTLGLGVEATEFYRALVKLRESEHYCGIGETAFRYWREAVYVC